MSRDTTVAVINRITRPTVRRVNMKATVADVG
jgi:hypothetical protein